MKIPSMKLKCWFDGACWPNPGGKAAYGWAISDDGDFKREGSGIIGCGPEMSNNVAEYMGLYHCLKFLHENNLHLNKISVFGDSKLVVKQMSGKWRAKRGLYIEAFKLAYCLIKEFPNIKVSWIPREHNTLADSIAGQCLNLRRDIVFGRN